MTERQKFRWLKQNRDLLTEGQRHCLTCINKAWGSRVHNWQHYGPQVVAMYRKVTAGLVEAGKSIPEMKPPQPCKRWYIRSI